MLWTPMLLTVAISRRTLLRTLHIQVALRSQCASIRTKGQAIQISVKVKVKIEWIQHRDPRQS